MLAFQKRAKCSSRTYSIPIRYGALKQRVKEKEGWWGGDEGEITIS